ncbi:MAG: triose-phosphate isomerase [Acidimicrobiia bacterium]|nr:triose-phosphate isomerase [Actinomycetota bacterium]MBL6924295.1 triose-phosphate isomerase [Acidimicrobiia bacterium]MBL6926104.1 triose-phosphate isomerase [Acidimicrobiia bacterium]
MTGERKPLISGNWKMNHNHFEAIQAVQKLSYLLSANDYDAVDVSVHPPFTDLRSVQTVLQSDEIPVMLGAQDCHWEANGAFTGEVAPGMLAKLDVSLVIVGHSERRQFFGETDQDVNKKVKAVLAAGMTPIMCCGETLDEREAGTTEARVSSQVRAGLSGVNPEQVGSLVVAYEPIWAIGTGVVATPEDAQAVCSVIRKVVGEDSGTAAADAVRIQYGGSVKPVSAPDLMRQPDIDGALVGGASLDPEEFTRIIAYRLVG